MRRDIGLITPSSVILSLKKISGGMKYHPSNNYAREYKVLSQFSHPQIPTRYQEGQDIMYKDGKFVLSQSYIVMTHFEGEDVVEYYKKRACRINMRSGT